MPKRNGSGVDLGQGRPATSRQLKLLHDAGLIAPRQGYVDRRQVVHYIEPVRLGQITAWLAGTEVGRAFPQSAPEPPDTTDSSA